MNFSMWVYLVYQEGASLWCLGFDKAKGGVMILGGMEKSE